jgi:hypothetical protein
LIYACGLRVCEPLNLRIKDVDLKQRRLYIHEAKGSKGRVILFPECLGPSLERQLVLAKAVAAQDLAQRVPVALPGLLAKKYPYAQHSERWSWLFPSRSLCRDPRANKLVRWRCHESNVQRAVRAAAHRCGLRCSAGCQPAVSQIANLPPAAENYSNPSNLKNFRKLKEVWLSAANRAPDQTVRKTGKRLVPHNAHSHSCGRPLRLCEFMRL